MSRIVFLCSGGGGNVRAVSTLRDRGAMPSLSYLAVIADRPCGAVEWARSQSIHCSVVPYTRDKPSGLGAALANASADIVVTTVHKILDDTLIGEYAGRIVNLHYSLLPAFSGVIGMEAVRRARAHRCRLLGATAHHVTSEVDAGAIIAQACVADEGGAPDAAVYDTVFRCGAVALAAAISLMLHPTAIHCAGTLTTDTATIFASPLPATDTQRALRERDFWDALR